MFSEHRRRRNRGVTLVELMVVITIIGIITASGAAKILNLLSYSELKVEEDRLREAVRYTRQLAVSHNCEAYLQLYRQSPALPAPFPAAGLYGGYKVVIDNPAIPLREDPDLTNGLDTSATPGVQDVTRNFNPRYGVIGEKDNNGVGKNTYLAVQPGVLDAVAVGRTPHRIVFDKGGLLVYPPASALPGPAGQKALTLVLQRIDNNESAAIVIRRAGGRVF